MTQITTNILSNWMTVHEHEQDTTLRDEFCDYFPPISSIPYRFNFGTFQWKIPAIGIRYIKKASAIHIHGNWFEPPTTIARLYLDDKFPKRLRASRNQRQHIADKKTPPLMIIPGVYKDMVYVDLKSAYFSLTNKWGWNADYFPGKWLIPGQNCLDFPLPDNKIARNCLVSFCLPSHTTIWTGQYYIRQVTHNLHINMGLWTLVQDVLHTIASEAQSYNAVYVHTDGYMIPKKNLRFFGEYLNSWGLKWGIKASGDVVLFGFGNWIIGGKQTKHFNPVIGKAHCYIRQLDTKVVQTLRKAKTSTHS